MSLAAQTAWLVLLAIPIACITWTFTHEEIFREPREYCAARSRNSRKLVPRKFFFIFTCEFCFSHYVAIGFLFLTHFHFLLPDWRGYFLALFALVWIANFYISIYGRLRLELKGERIEIAKQERHLREEPPKRVTGTNPR